MWRCKNTIALILSNRLNASRTMVGIEGMDDSGKGLNFGKTMTCSNDARLAFSFMIVLIFFRIGTLHFLFEVYCLFLLLWHDYLGAVCTWN
mmetsp:Transcript_13617/g.28759  ORF Transcript_13617/g.28759 Transcript_13617/m.28759 type:complete len:91 (+) Transcript_13617:255-527(+)